MDIRPLHIPKSKKVTGLKIFCHECDRYVGETCRKNGKPLSKCEHGDKQVYKIVIHQPGTKYKVWTKNLKTRILDEAIREKYMFADEIKSRSNLNENTSETKRSFSKQEENVPLLLKYASSGFIGWMNNENVPFHLQKQLSKEHVKDNERALKVLTECMVESGFDLETFTMDEINDAVVGVIYKYLIDKKFAPRTLNKYMGTYKALISWYMDKFDQPLRNYFKKVKQEPLYPEPQAIPLKEIEALLERVTPENGKKIYYKGKGGSRYLYKSWLVAGFRLALETGARREELIRLKWSDIKEEDGERFIETEDFKINRIMGRTDPKRKKVKYFTITKSLEQLLTELGYNIYKGTDQYILAPEVTDNRVRVISDALSKAFSHYYQQLENGKKLTFKSLRKTHITYLQIKYGKGNIKSRTGHTNDNTIQKSYIDPKLIVQSQYGEEIFNNEDDRITELKEVRSENQNKDKSKNQER